MYVERVGEIAIAILSEMIYMAFRIVRYSNHPPMSCLYEIEICPFSGFVHMHGFIGIV
jgi:hypothetical protein